MSVNGSQELISGQSRLFGSNPVVWLCDQESTETFLKVAPPENRKVRRWWTFLAQLNLRLPAVFNVGDYVPVSRKRFKQFEVPKGATKDVMWYAPYLVTGVSSGGTTACCSPTLGGEVPVAFEFAKRFPFELEDDYREDTIEEGDTGMLNDHERAALADEQDIVANE